MLLFVYGTLMRGDCRAYLLADQRFVGPAATAAGYRLHDLGAYPGMVEDLAAGVVYGELYEIADDRWPRLDAEEGVDVGLYRRAGVQLSDDLPADIGPAETYLYNGPVTGRPDLNGRWPVR